MISARGAMPTSVVMMEVAHTTTKTRDVLLLSDIEKTWRAVGRVLRHHLLHGQSVSIFPKTFSFAVLNKLVAHDHGSKYHVREPFFGVHPTFGTQYGLSGDVPRESASEPIKRLPMDMVAAEAKLPADVCNYALREMFLFVGEAVYNHKLVQLEFPGVCSVLIKRDRAAVAYEADFVSDLFQIDSRKWPPQLKAAVAEARAGAIPVVGLGGMREGRPSSAGSTSAASTRPRSASRPTSAGSASPAKASEETPRPSFVSAAPSSRTFDELAKDKPRSLPPSARGARPSSGQRRGPLKPRTANAAPEAKPDTLSPAAIAGIAIAGEEEEESIYALATPSRHRDVESEMASEAAAAPAGDDVVAFPFPVQESAANLDPAAVTCPADDGVGEAPVSTAAAVGAARPASGRMQQHHRHTPLWGPGAFEEKPDVAHGRRRIEPAHDGYTVGNLLKDPSPRRFPKANPALYDTEVA